MNDAILTKRHGYGRYERGRLTLDDAMRILGAKWTGEPHIAFDPGVDYQYRIIRTQTNDGTLAFFHELLYDSMIRLFNRTTYFKDMGPPPDRAVVRYTIGNIRHAAVFGRVKLPCSATKLYPGQRESIVIPVRCEYVLDPETSLALPQAA